MIMRFRAIPGGLKLPPMRWIYTLLAVCLASAAAAAPRGAGGLAPTEAACVLEVNKRSISLSRVHGKEQLRCLKRGATGKEAEPDACRFVDARGKLRKAGEKAAKGEAKKCTGTPAFAFAGVDVAALAVADASWGVVGDLLGSTVDATLVRGDKAGAKCQLDLVKRSHGLLDTIWQELYKAKKRALGGKAPAVTSQAGLEAALQTALGASAKLAKRAAALRSGAEKRCGARSDLADLFPGECASSSAAELATCAEQSVRCRACQAANRADSLQLDCDTFDDGETNLSCPWKTPPTVTLQLDEANAARAMIGREGGSLAATGSDGTTFTLDVPAGALAEDVEIAVVPVAAIPDLPLGAQLLAAVHFEPEGLTFKALGGATLTIELPSAPVAPFGFGWEGSGEEFHLRPKQIAGATLSFDVLHFSGVGAAEGDADGAAEWAPSHWEQEAGNDIVLLIDAQGINPDFTEPAFIDALLRILRRWYRVGVLPKVYLGLNASSFYESGVLEVLSFLSEQAYFQLLTLNATTPWGAPQDALASENANLRRVLEDGFEAKVAEIITLCEAREDAEAFVLEAADHEATNDVLDLLPPPADARPDAILPFFEGRCIDVKVVEVEAAVWLAPGARDAIDIRTGWSGPSGVLHHDSHPVRVDLEVLGGSLEPSAGVSSTVDGTFSTEITMESDTALVTVRPHLQQALWGEPFTFAIGECEPVDLGVLVWPAIFAGEWDLTLNVETTSCEPGSACVDGTQLIERTISPECGHRIATGGFGVVAVPGAADVELIGNTVSWSGSGTRQETDCDPVLTYAVSMTGSYTTDGTTLTGTRTASYTGLCANGVGGISGTFSVTTSGVRSEP